VVVKTTTPFLEGFAGLFNHHQEDTISIAMKNAENAGTTKPGSYASGSYLSEYYSCGDSAI
jgi:hypothetical protein